MNKVLRLSLCLVLIAMFSQSLIADPIVIPDGIQNIQGVIPEYELQDHPGIFRETDEGVCEAPIYTDKPPFLVSTLLRDYDAQPTRVRKITEPLITPAPNGQTLQKGVPSFSILKLISEFGLTLVGADPVGAGATKVEVEVLSLPNEQAVIDMKTNRRLAGAAKALPMAEEGETGQFRVGALRHIPQFVFKVKDAAVLSNFPEIEKFLKNASTSVRFTNKDGKFLSRKCCRTSFASRTSRLRETTTPGPICRNEYVFEVVSDRDPESYLKQYYDNTFKNELFTALFPVPNETLIPLSNILNLIEEPGFDFIDFKYFDTRGFVKIPLEKPENFRTSKGEKVIGMQRGPLNTVHYRSDDPNANDAYGHPTSICAFFQAVKKFNGTCTTPGCRIQWGDFYHSDFWYTHVDHVNGSCVDVRPLRKSEGYGPLNIFVYSKKCTKNQDGTQKCTTVSSLNREYDRVNTQKLVDTFIAAGGVGKAEEDGTVKIQNLLFNDTRGVKGVTRARGHDNHIHVCFPPQNQKVQTACEAGVL